MTHRFLIDECLSPDLVQVAIDAGFECTCVRDRGLLGARDDFLMKFLLKEDFTLVTENAADFRALFGDQELHPGLICLGSEKRMDRETQRELFQVALKEIGQDLTNQLLEVIEDENGEITVSTSEHAAPSV
jgi:predicted nuclease of predicted toxin-antitoxin system